ncbi:MULTISPECIES: hypothetical protein [Streptomyces]|uniref:hypothetical protein n=1 Tax=Streptomyces TaxID=1883 RepID=UPI0029A70D8B|nr:hypothetical protein [Streptomyces sp. WI03-4A]MDX2592773.1 hypothetical protein [Streptomyces sp. WI03-4A]
MIVQEAQHAAAAGPDSFRIHQIADRFEVYSRSGQFFGEYLARASAEQQVSVLMRRAQRVVPGAVS